MTTPLSLSFNKQDPLTYDTKATVQQKRALENLSHLDFKGNENVLDVGSGNGYISSILASHKVPQGKVLGIDVDPAMVEFANSKYKAKNIEFYTCDAKQIPFPQQFDVVTSFAVLSWIPLEDHECVMRNMYQSLRINGRLLMRLASEGKRPLHEVIRQVCQEAKWQSYFLQYHPNWAFQQIDPFKEMLEKIGFKNIYIQDATTTSHFNDLNRFADWLTTWVPHRHAIPESLWQEFFFSIAKAYCIHCNQLENQITITMPAMLVKADK